nr:immunoglobulin light chain junction region [Macaca mulatta]MOX79757.1 immunoglobulin light chain junction region [Macaca mulatta]
DYYCAIWHINAWVF